MFRAFLAFTSHGVRASVLPSSIQLAISAFLFVSQWATSFAVRDSPVLVGGYFAIDDDTIHLNNVPSAPLSQAVQTQCIAKPKDKERITIIRVHIRTLSDGTYSPVLQLSLQRHIYPQPSTLKQSSISR